MGGATPKNWQRLRGPMVITGAGGQVGRALRALLPDAKAFTHSEMDLTDRDALMREVVDSRPEVIFNAAAYTRVDDAEREPEAAMTVNRDGVANLAAAAAHVGALLVHLSTDYVFSGTKPDPYDEEDEPEPVSAYGKSKLAGESEAQGAGRHLIVRTSWVFGEGRNFVRAILGAASSRDEVRVVNDQRGLSSYAPDLAEGLISLVQAGAEGVYHLAGGGPPATWAEVAEHAIECAGLRTRVRRVSTSDYYAGQVGPVATRPPNSVLDCSKAAGLGVELRPWTQAVAEYVKEIA